MRLGDLIDTLEALPPDAPIVYDTGAPVGDFGSWRGIYAQLTLYPSQPYDNGKPLERARTVAEILRRAKSADGDEFAGYKGGEFRMDRNTPVWADHYGECRYIGIMGVRMEDGRAILVTADLSDYRD